MKNQNDLIWSIVFGFVTLVVVILCVFVFPATPITPTAPAVVATADAPLPAMTPVMASSLPAGSNNAPAGNAPPSFGPPSGPGSPMRR